MSILTALQNAIPFTDDDLAQNQRGTLSEAQQARLNARKQHAHDQARKVAYGGVIFLVVGGVLSWTTSNAPGTALAFFVLAGGVYYGWHRYAQWKQQPSAPPPVKSITGRVARESRTTSYGPDNMKTRTVYELWITPHPPPASDEGPAPATQRLRVDKEVWETFPEGASYTLYFVNDKGTRMLLSAEQAGQASA